MAQSRDEPSPAAPLDIVSVSTSATSGGGPVSAVASFRLVGGGTLDGAPVSASAATQQPRRSSHTLALGDRPQGRLFRPSSVRRSLFACVRFRFGALLPRAG